MKKTRLFLRIVITVTVHSVHSNVSKIHSRLPAAMEFWLVCLGIVVCEQLQNYLIYSVNVTIMRKAYIGVYTPFYT